MQRTLGGKHELSSGTGEKESQVFDITSLDTYDLLSFFISILSAQAWQHMGLRVKPGTDKIEKDLERAKVAIDCTVFLMERMEAHIADKDKEALRGLLADLQINFSRLALGK
jgi:hypothetical protein